MDITTVDGLREHLCGKSPRLIEPSKCRRCQGKNPLIEMTCREGPALDEITLSVFCVFCCEYPRSVVISLTATATVTRLFGEEFMPDVMLDAVIACSASYKIARNG